MKHVAWIFMVLMCIGAQALADSVINAATAQSLVNERFFVFDNGAGRGKWTPEEQALVVSELGFAGIGYSGTEDLDVRLKAFGAIDERIFNIYVPCYVDREPAIGEDLKAAIKLLEGTGVTIWLTVQGKSESDAKAVAVVREVGALAAKHGVQVALYPHAGFFVADIADALRVVKQVKMDNVGVTFNLCHELKAGNEARFDELLAAAKPHLFLVSINGADHEGGWDKLIQPLGKGPFDVEGLLRKILTMGYEGPIGLQCYAVPGDTRSNMEHNIAEWKKMVSRLAAK